MGRRHVLTALEHFSRNFATVALLVKRFSKVVDVVEARVQLDLGRICAWIAWQRLIVDCGKAPSRVAIVEGGDDAVDGISYAHEDLVLAGDAGPVWSAHVDFVQVDARPSA